MFDGNEPWRRVSPMKEPTFRAWMERLATLVFLGILLGAVFAFTLWFSGVR